MTKPYRVQVVAREAPGSALDLVVLFLVVATLIVFVGFIA
jgi:hypothetical protein